MKKKNAFGLLGIIIIMIVTALISSVTTGVIMLNSSLVENKNNLIEDKELNKFVEVYETLLNKYYDEIDKEGMLKAAEEGMLNFLGDKYTTYLEDSEYNDIINELSATYDGIGVEIQNNLIMGIVPDSPAESVGLQVNDLIIKINDTIVTNLDGTQISEIIKKANGTITLVIQRNGTQLDFQMEKIELINQSIKYQLIDNTQIGYLLIQNFSENLADQVSLALKELESKGINSLIIDVRDNVGGYLSSAEKTAALFLEKDKAIYSLESSESTFTYKDTTEEKRNYKIAVLINGNTASASEILASALKDSYGAILIGTKSYGKGKVQQILSLNNGDSVKVSTAKWLTPNNICIEGEGIYPDYNIIWTNNGDYDSQVEKAIELLS